ncbi:MAG: hypothetical protein KIS77_02595 [Saprospiraceae bacterium]|nr:hypothetical protein [Saprospiraceae bacterium]
MEILKKPTSCLFQFQNGAIANKTIDFQLFKINGFEKPPHEGLNIFGFAKIYFYLPIVLIFLAFTFASLDA